QATIELHHQLGALAPGRKTDVYRTRDLPHQVGRARGQPGQDGGVLAPHLDLNLLHGPTEPAGENRNACTTHPAELPSQDAAQLILADVSFRLGNKADVDE